MFFFFFKQKTAYEMRISDWSSDVCSSDLEPFFPRCAGPHLPGRRALADEVQGGMPRPELLRGLLPAPRHRPADLRAARRDPPAIRRRMRNPDFQDAEGRNRRLISGFLDKRRLCGQAPPM